MEKKWNSVFILVFASIVLLFSKIESANINGDNLSDTTRQNSQIALMTDVTTPETIYDLTLADSTVEYSYTLPSDCSDYEFQTRTSVDIRYSSGIGGTVTNYRTLKSGGSYNTFGRTFAKYASKVLHFKCPTSNNIVVEITVWRKP